MLQSACVVHEPTGPVSGTSASGGSMVIGSASLPGTLVSRPDTLASLPGETDPSMLDPGG
jgi:hypothetical protein